MNQSQYNSILLVNLFNLDGKLFCGYQTGSRISENGILLSLNIKFKIINTKTCYEQIKMINAESGQQFLNELKDTFVGRTVQANYGKYKFYKIEDISLDKNVTNTFIRRKNSIRLVYYLDNGNLEELPLLKYYKDSYEKTVQYTNQPLFITSTEDPKTLIKQFIYLVPELLLMTGLDNDIRDNDNLKREMITRTKLDPRRISI
jgi:hypothetical protein